MSPPEVTRDGKVSLRSRLGRRAPVAVSVSIALRQPRRVASTHEHAGGLLPQTCSTLPSGDCFRRTLGGCSLMNFPDPHFVPKDPARWARISQHLLLHPEALSVALENIDRWEQRGRVHPGPLREWRRRILAAASSATAMDHFLQWLAADNADAEPLKSCSPFAGILSPPA
jgi:hypothetical protein